jgi:hypothetical protein
LTPDPTGGLGRGQLVSHQSLALSVRWDTCRGPGFIFSSLLCPSQLGPSPSQKLLLLTFFLFHTLFPFLFSTPFRPPCRRTSPPPPGFGFSSPPAASSFQGYWGALGTPEPKRSLSQLEAAAWASVSDLVTSLDEALLPASALWPPLQVSPWRHCHQITTLLRSNFQT